MLWIVIPAVAAPPLDRVVATVDTEIVLASDAQLDRSLAGPGDWGLFWDRATIATDSALVVAAAGTLALYEPTPGAIQARRQALGPEVEAMLTRWGFDREATESRIRRVLRAERFLARNIPAGADETEGIERILTQLRGRFRVRDRR